MVVVQLALPSDSVMTRMSGPRMSNVLAKVDCSRCGDTRLHDLGITEMPEAKAAAL
jgi:hypothetical protein